MYSVTNLQNNQTTAVYQMPSCDFAEIMDMLRTFHEDNNLEDCVLAVRDYADDEQREHQIAPALTAYKEKISKAEKDGKSIKRYKQPQIKPVDPSSGTAYVVSFGWMVHKLDNIKRIEYLFYDEGWPGRIIVSKRASVLYPTEIEITCINRDSDLQNKFLELLKKTEIGPSKI